MKSAEAFRTISEVASELDLPQHVLRFWETRFAQVRPMKRGGGRRYYRPEDIALLKGIRKLLYTDGFTIKGVQKILRERGVQEVIAASGEEAGEADGAGDGAGAGPVASADVVRLPLAGRAADSAARPSPGNGAGAVADPRIARAGIQAAIDELTSLKALLDRARG